MAQGIDSVIQLRYYHLAKKCESDIQNDEENNDELDSKKIKQSMVLRTINYKQILDCKYLIDKK